jgi:hypothetical protein
MIKEKKKEKIIIIIHFPSVSIDSQTITTTTIIL